MVFGLTRILRFYCTHYPDSVLEKKGFWSLLTILPKVMRPTRAVGGSRLRESWRDSCAREKWAPDYSQPHSPSGSAVCVLHLYKYTQFIQVFKFIVNNSQKDAQTYNTLSVVKPSGVPWELGGFLHPDRYPQQRGRWWGQHLNAERKRVWRRQGEGNEGKMEMNDKEEQGKRVRRTVILTMVAVHALPVVDILWWRTVGWAQLVGWSRR